MMDAEQALAASLNGKFFGLPEVDPWAPKRAERQKPDPPVRRVLALPPSIVGTEDRKAARRTAILSLRDADGSPTLEQVIAAVSEVTEIPIEQIKSAQRYMQVTRARMIFYYVCKMVTTASLVSVARFVGDRDHSTVKSGQKCVHERRRYYEPDLSKVLARFERKGDTG